MVLYRFTCCLAAVCCLSASVAAQTNLSKEEFPAYRALDSLMKKMVEAHPQDDLYTQLSRAYKALNRWPNAVLLPVDTIAYRARMTTGELMSGIATVYVWQGLYDSLHFNTALQDVLPAVAAYDGYLCNCIAPDAPAMDGHYSAAMRRRLDSCRGAVHAWSGWAGYKRLADSVGVMALRGKSQQAYAAYLLKTCNSFRTIVRLGLLYSTGISPHEQFIVRLNAFHAHMVGAVAGINAQPAAPYTNAAELKSLQSYLKTIGNTFKGRQAELRMSFYNDTGKFYFLTRVGDSMRVHSLLSYSFADEGGGFRIRDLRYRLRNALPAQDKRDADIFRHLFTYPLMPLSEYGLPLNGGLPAQQVVPSTYHKYLSALDLMPPTE